MAHILNERVYQGGSECSARGVVCEGEGISRWGRGGDILYISGMECWGFISESEFKGMYFICQYLGLESSTIMLPWFAILTYIPVCYVAVGVQHSCNGCNGNFSFVGTYIQGRLEKALLKGILFP